MNAHVVVVSDRAASGERADLTAPLLWPALEVAGFVADAADAKVTVVPDDRARIVEELRKLLARGVRLILTTGGTGAAPRDVTPEATREVIERELPGFGELMRAESLKKTVHAAGSRAIAGTKARSLIVNLPGSPKGAVECLGFILKPARHVLELLAGNPMDCGSPPS